MGSNFQRGNMKILFLLTSFGIALVAFWLWMNVVETVIGLLIASALGIWAFRKLSRR